MTRVAYRSLTGRSSEKPLYLGINCVLSRLYCRKKTTFRLKLHARSGIGTGNGCIQLCPYRLRIPDQSCKSEWFVVFGIRSIICSINVGCASDGVSSPETPTVLNRGSVCS